ncbi:MAG: BatA domain-containing protein [Planctomycetota bacterium]|nr:BatA domain-containing protein [Planctomycetota bacterium]
MFGISFLNPGLLIGSLLVAAPILIHLLNRRRFRIVDWAAMEFLLEADLRNRRRIRLEHLILLLLRCALIVLIVLLVSRPALQGGSSLPFVGALEKEARILVLDDSMSMSHKPDDLSAFERAKEGLKAHLEVLRQERPRDPVTIIRASKPEVPLWTGEYPREAKLAELGQRLARLEVSDGSLSLGAALDSILEAIPEEERELSRSITIITDLRRVDFFDETGRPDAAVQDAFAAFENLPVSFFIANVGHSDERNIAVTELVSMDSHTIAGIPAQLQARVTNFGTDPTDDISLAFTVGDASPPPYPVGKLGPGESKVVPFPYTFAESGSSIVRAEIGADPLEADNHRLFALEVREHLEVIVVDGEPAADRGEDEVYFLMQALAPAGDILSGVNPRAIIARILGEERLEFADVVVLANVYALPEKTRDRLEEFTRSGGGLVIFLGDQCDPQLYNRHLYRDGKGLLPVSIGDIREEDARFSGEALSHPIFEGFAGPNISLLGRVRVRKTVLATSSPSGDGRVILAYDDPERTPAVIEMPFGRGRVILFMTACDREWSAWPTDPSYPLTMLKMIDYVARTPGTARNLRPGSPIELVLDPTKAEPEAMLRTPGYPDEEPVLVRATPRSDDQTLRFAWRETRRAGPYRLIQRTRDGGEADQWFAVNPAPREGDLRRIDEAEVLTLVPMAKIAFVSDLSKLGSERGEGDAELWKIIAIAMGILLFVELFLAWRFSHHE